MTPRSSTEARAHRQPARTSGYVLLPVVMLITLIAVMAFSLNHQGPMGGGTVTSYAEAERAEQVARAGLQHAAWQTRQAGCGPYTDITAEPLGQHSYTTTLTTDLASTSSYTRSVDQDSWIRSDQPTTNKATDDKLHIRFESGVIERPMYRYDLSAVPANVDILSATAWFYVSKEHPEGPVDIHRLTADWTETDATWDSMGDKMDAAVLATIPSQPVAGVWVSVNLTAQVQSWVNGQPNYGITLNSTSEGTHGDYASREAAQQPYLEVIVGTPPTPTASLNSIGTLANGVTRTIARDNVVLYQSPPGFMQYQPGASDGKDSFFLPGDPNFGGNTNLRLSTRFNGFAEDSWVVLQFDVGSIPHDAEILSAQLELYQASAPNGTSGYAEVYRISRDWSELDVTWVQRTGTSNWATAGGDYDSEVIARTLLDTPTGWYSWEIRKLVAGWVRGDYPNHGLLIRSDENNLEYRDFNSSEHSSSLLRPKLTISYSCQCGMACVAPQGLGKIALIGDDSSPDPDDQLKIQIIESWGYQVDFYEDQNSDTVNWSNYDLAYVSETVISGAVNTNLTNLSIGVINEEPLLYPDMAQGNSFGNKVDASIDITDNSHYITAPFALVPLPIYAGDMEIITLSNPLPTGTRVLAENGGDSVLTVLDQGAINNWGNPSPGRRVTLPLGRHFATDFNWTQLNHNGRLLVQRAIAWAMKADTVSIGNVLMVVGNDGSLTGQESAKRALIESWGYAVSVIDEDDSQSEFDTAVGAHEVVFIGEDVNAGDLGTKLVNASIGVVTEEANLADEFGLSDGIAWGSGVELGIDDATHYITQPFAVGTLTVLTTSESLAYLTPSFAPDLALLGRIVGGLALTALDSGASLVGGGTAAGRRVLLPWGGNNMDVNHLNDDGLTIFRRSLEWARGATLPGPIAHWKLDETSGPTAVDSIGGHDGTLINEPSWTTGRVDGGLDFDGGDDTVDAGSDAALDEVFAGGATLTAWIRPRSWGEGNFGRIADKADNLGSNRNGWAFELYGAQRALLFQYGFSGAIGNWYTPVDSITLGNWHHVAVVYDNSADTNDPLIYIDGVPQTLIELDTPSGTPSSDAAINLTLGNYALDTSRTFDGVLDDIRLYDRTLSASEIADLAIPPPLLPIAHWKLDETSGTTAVDSAGGHHGTVTNATWTTGQLAGGLEFNSASDNVTVPHDATLSLTEAVTLSAWIYKTGPLTGYKAVVVKASTGSDLNYFLGTWQDQVVFGFSTTTDNWQGYYSSSANLQAGTWYHIAASYDNAYDSVRLYLNGTLIDSFTTTLEPVTNNANLWLGRSAIGEYWSGTLDDVRIYNRALGDADIADLAAGSGGGAPGGGGPTIEPPGNCDGTYRDEFNLTDFAGSDGTINWGSVPWTEVGESDGETSGDIRITNDTSNYQLRTRDNQNGGEGVEREADLSGATTATLSYEYRRDGLDNSNDYTAVSVSSNGAAGPWTELTRHQGGGSDSSYVSISHNISSFISANTAIRFQTSSNMGNNDTVWFDNIQIECRP